MDSIVYPDLEELIEKTERILSKSKYFLSALERKRKMHKVKDIDLCFSAYAFLQMWSDTTMGRDMSDEGKPVMVCDAFVRGCTTVIFEDITGVAVVFSNDGFLYIVDEPNEAFLEDLKTHSVNPRSSAMKKYECCEYKNIRE